MAKIEILSRDQTARWHEKLQAVDGHDVYFFPEYGETFSMIDSGTAQLFVYEEDDKRFLYPFRLRHLPLLEQFREYAEYRDVTANYGYGGPLIAVPDALERPEFIRRAVRAFDEYCHGARVVAEFCRYHTLFDNAIDVRHEYAPMFCNQTVWVDLTLDEETWRRQMRENHRRDIRKAEKQGVTVEASHTPHSVSLFYELYTQTMIDVGAARYYFFPREFFEETVRLLPEHSEIFLARYQEQVIAAVLYIWGDEFLHYHFGGTDRRYAHIRAAKTLHYHVMTWGKSRGFKKLHLGGGFGGSDADSLMRFKSGFSTRRADFYIAKRIHHQKIYRELCAKVGVNPDTEPFFPAYRAVSSWQ